MRTEDELRSALRAGLPDADVVVDEGRAGVQRRVRRTRYQRAGLAAALVLVAVAAVIPGLLRGGGEEVEMRPVDVQPSANAERCLAESMRAVYAEGDWRGRHWVVGADRRGGFTVNVATVPGTCGDAALVAPSTTGRDSLVMGGPTTSFGNEPVAFGSIDKDVDRVRVTLVTGVVIDLKPIATGGQYDANVFVHFAANDDEHLGLAEVAAWRGSKLLQEIVSSPHLECAANERPELRPPGEVVGDSQEAVARLAREQWFSAMTDFAETQLSADPPRPGGSMMGNLNLVRKGKLVGKIGTFSSGGEWRAWVLFRCAPR